MSDSPRKWLADYFIQSEVKLVGEKKLHYAHPNGLYEVNFTNAVLGEEPSATLRAQIVVAAPDIESAEVNTEKHLTQFLHVLSFAASTGFRLLRRTILIDWSPGPPTRDFCSYSAHPEEEAVEALETSILDTVGLLHSWGAKPYVDRALRWYSSAVRSRIMEDQFQYFWFVIELIANAGEERQKVTDKCQKCRGDLKCSACGAISTHRPFPRQLIEALLTRLTVSDQTAADLFFTRNALLHGEDRNFIEEHIRRRIPNFSFDKMVDVAGRVAWRALLASFEVPSGSHKPVFLQPNTFVDWRMSARVVGQIGVGGDPNNPQFEHVDLPKLTIERPTPEVDKRGPIAKDAP